MYVELVEKGINNRGNFIKLSEVKRQPYDFERYISLFPFTVDVLDYVKINKTIRGYTGRHYCPVVIIDIDVPWQAVYSLLNLQVICYLLLSIFLIWIF